MARPTKVGLDYFPLDVHADDKIELVEAEHGLEGFAILIKLYQRIYNNGYCCDWNEDTCMLFAKKINTEQTLVSSVVNTCLRRRLFDKGMYELYGILTSKGIQTRFSTICKSAKRKGFKVADQHCLLVNPEETPVNPEETPSKPPLTPSESTQSKVNKSKGDKLKDKPELKSKTFKPPSLEEVKKYCEERNNGLDPENFIDHYEANGWMRGKTKIKDWKACVRTWEKNEVNNSQPSQNNEWY